MMDQNLYRELYLRLFNRVTDALIALEQRNYGQTEDILKQAQLECESIYIEHAP